MESDFILKATDKQAKALFNDDTYATVKLMKFLGDKQKYPEMDYNDPTIHRWRIKLRYQDEVGEISGTITYNALIKLLKSRSVTNTPSIWK